jgi:hypothetical protein
MIHYIPLIYRYSVALANNRGRFCNYDILPPGSTSGITPTLSILPHVDNYLLST